MSTDLGWPTSFSGAAWHLQPEDVGLPRKQRRRTSGLRGEEEVASLCHMSTDYYARLERELGAQPSAQMIATDTMTSQGPQDRLRWPLLPASLVRMRVLLRSRSHFPVATIRPDPASVVGPFTVMSFWVIVRAPKLVSIGRLNADAEAPDGSARRVLGSWTRRRRKRGLHLDIAGDQGCQLHTGPGDQGVDDRDERSDDATDDRGDR